MLIEEVQFVLFVIVKSTFGSVFTIKRPKDESAARACDVLMVKTLNKCSLCSLVSNLVFHR